MVPALPFPTGTGSRRRRRRRGGGNGVIANSGEVTLSRVELLTSVELPANKGEGAAAVELLPSANVMSWLYKISVAFDRIVWMRARVTWKPCVGTTTNGSLVYGVDWNSNKSGPTRESVQALTPNVENAVWQAATLVLPQDRLMTRRYYNLNSASKEDRQPGTLSYHVKGAAQATAQPLGDLWIEYTVRLSGTQA